ncbi:F0F1 ATP synthase subunit B' [Alphaproteobacteria bacterium]|nr:F0F1 ATP synthase subunit B' [Alphaproteobacteria bacterium]
MPQLDITTFIPQLFWLIITFVTLYLIMSMVILPKIADVLEQRQDRIASDIQEAERLKLDAEIALKDYESVLFKAKENAQEISAKNKLNIINDINKENERLDADLKEKLAIANEKINIFKAKAEIEIASSASETSILIAKKISNLNISLSEAKKEVIKQTGQKL